MRRRAILCMLDGEPGGEWVSAQMHVEMVEIGDVHSGWTQFVSGQVLALVSTTERKVLQWSRGPSGASWASSNVINDSDEV